jgi:Domain of unknown function (DUF397)
MKSKECPMITPDLSRVVWHKSSYSSTQGNCVEVAMNAGAVAVRDSKNVVGPVLAFPAHAWHKFLGDRAVDLG